MAKIKETKAIKIYVSNSLFDAISRDTHFSSNHISTTPSEGKTNEAKVSIDIPMTKDDIVIDLLTRAHQDMVTTRESGDMGNYEPTNIEKEIKEFLDGKN